MDRCLNGERIDDSGPGARIPPRADLSLPLAFGRLPRPAKVDTLADSGYHGCLSAARETPHDHRVAARYRSVQVHDDAGRAAPFSRRTGRIPLQMPDTWHRPDTVLESDRARDHRPVRPSLHARGAPIPAALALPHERLRRPARPVPA